MKRLLISMTILALLVVPQFALCSDVDDLKAANQKMFEAYVSQDAETIGTLVYPGAVAYTDDAAFPFVVSIENAQSETTDLMNTVFSNYDYFVMTPYNMQYKVVGDTGIVWGHITIDTKPTGEPGQTNYLRHISTWIKSDGNWRWITFHNSTIPPGD
jgi:hypothetical protein